MIRPKKRSAPFEARLICDSDAAKNIPPRFSSSKAKSKILRFSCQDQEVQLPPHSVELELAVLGALALEPDKAASRLSGLGSGLFYDTLNKAAFMAITGIVAQGGIPDTVTLFQHRPSDIDKNVWNPFVGSLPDRCAHVDNYPQHVADLRWYAGRRALLQLAGQATTYAYDATISRVDLPQQFAEQADSILSQFGNHNGLPDIVDCASFISEPAAKPDELIVGILHKGTKLCLGGGSKSFKTWTLLDLAVSVATGSDWWGFETKQGPVLYCNFEIQTAFFHERLKAVCQAKGINLKPGQLDHWPLRGRAVDFDELYHEFKAKLAGREYALIVIDPVYKLLGKRDENAAGDIGSLLNGFEKLAVETGAAIAFGSHFSKGNQAAKESIDRISGSGVFARDPDSILTLTKHEQEGAFTVEPVLRNLPPVEAFVVRWEFPLMHRDGELDPSKLKKAGGRKASYTVEDVVDVLRESKAALSTTKWQSIANEELGVGDRTFYSLKKQAIDQGVVFKSKTNDGWMAK